MLYELFHKDKFTFANFKLTKRGKAVLSLLIKGNTYPKIATILNMTQSGVRKHIEIMLLENNFSTIYELIANYYMQDDTIKR